ncbi:MAG: S-layer homology domain-containing protein, partial [Clostridia bacterium]|nr:S-layer homology domain-containing protein [Clostridia bacterium]
MKKKIISLALAALMLFLLIVPMGAMAGAASYGRVPIYIGFADIDYMAEQILKEIPTEGKTSEEQIRAVYDWIQKNCKRDGAGDKYYFDEDAIEPAVETYYNDMVKKLDRGEAVIRPDLESEYMPENITGYSMSYDSRAYVANFAYEMMLTRTGNCAHFSALFTVLLGHLGYDCRLIDGEFINGDGSSVEHKWNYVLVGDRYYWFDIRMDHANYTRTGNLSYQYFMIEDTNAWSKQHRFDHTYADALKAHTADVTSLYEELSVPANLEPWERCSEWAKGYMKNAYDAGLIPDVLSGQDLTENITRAEFAAVSVKLYEKLTGKTAPAAGANPFTDTSDENVLKAYSLGIVNGMGGGLFAPQSTLSREQAATMLGRVYELYSLGEVKTGESLESAGAATFADDAAIGAWAKNYIYFFVGKGVINGVGNNMFAPLSSMTREAALKIAVETAAQ